MAAFHGIQVYEILENGNVLNAIYTNTGLFINKRYFIDNEIATKITFDQKGVEGSYDCKYIETTNPLVMLCDLEILKIGATYEFTWSRDKKPIYRGLGLMTGITHISVSVVEA